MSTKTTELTPGDLHVAADRLRECGLDAIADRMRAVARLVERDAARIAEWKAAGDWRGDVDWESLAEAVPPGWWLAEDSHSQPGWWLHQRKPEWDGAAWISGGDITRPSRSLAWQYDVDSKDTLVQRPWLPSDVLRVWEAATRDMPNNVPLCAGMIGPTPCPSRESCRRCVQLPYRDERPGAEYVWTWPKEPDPKHPDRCELFMEATT